MKIGEKVIEYLKQRPQELNMRYFYRPGRDGCGTTACLAGHIILRSGVSLYCDDPPVAFLSTLSATQEPSAYWVEYQEQKYPWLCCQLRHIAALARELWAKDYGDESAKSLPFFHDEWFPDDDDESSDLQQVTAGMVIERLQRIIEAAPCTG